MVDRPSSLPAKPAFDALPPYFNPFGTFGVSQPDYNHSPALYDYVHPQRPPGPVPVAGPNYLPTSANDSFSSPPSDLEKLQRLKREILAGKNAFYAAPPQASMVEKFLPAAQGGSENDGQQIDTAADKALPTGPRAKRNRNDKTQPSASASESRTKSDRPRKGETKSQKRRAQPHSGPKEDREPKSSTRQLRGSRTVDAGPGADQRSMPSSGLPSADSLPALASAASQIPSASPAGYPVSRVTFRSDDKQSPVQGKQTPALTPIALSIPSADQYGSILDPTAAAWPSKNTPRVQEDDQPFEEGEQIVSVRRPESATGRSSRNNKVKPRASEVLRPPAGSSALSNSQRSDKGAALERTAPSDRYNKREAHNRLRRSSVDSGPSPGSRARPDIDSKSATESSRKPQTPVDPPLRSSKSPVHTRSGPQSWPNASDDPKGHAGLNSGSSTNGSRKGSELEKHQKIVNAREQVRQFAARLTAADPSISSRSLGERLDNSRETSRFSSQPKRPADERDHLSNAPKRQLLDRVEPASDINRSGNRSRIAEPSSFAVSRPPNQHDSSDDRPLSARLAAPPLSARIAAPGRVQQSSEVDEFGRARNPGDRPLKERLALENEPRVESNRSVNGTANTRKGASFVRSTQNAPPSATTRGFQRGSAPSVSDVEPVDRSIPAFSGNEFRPSANPSFPRYPPEDHMRDSSGPVPNYSSQDVRPHGAPPVAHRSTMLEQDRLGARNNYPPRASGQLDGQGRLDNREVYERDPVPDRRTREQLDPRFQPREDVYREFREPPRDWPPPPDRYLPAVADPNYRSRSPVSHQRYDGDRPSYPVIDPGYYPPPLPPLDYDPYYEQQRYLHDRAAYDYDAGRPATSAFPGDRTWNYSPARFEREGPYSAAAQSFSRAPERPMDLGPPLNYYGREARQASPPREASYNDRGDRGPPNDLGSRIEGQKESYTRRGGKSGNAGAGRGDGMQQQGARKVSAGRGRGRGRDRGRGQG